MNQPLSLRRRLLYCFLSALLVWFSFPNFLNKTLAPPLAFLGWIALVPFFLALRDVKPRQGAFLGLFFGFLQMGGILYWIALLEEAKYLSGLAWFALVLYLSLYFSLFGWIYRFLVTRLQLSSLWIAPVVWVGLEYIRGSRPWGGFSWGEIGYSQASYPTLLAVTSLAGVYGLTFLMVWVNACLAKGLESFSDSAAGTSRLSRAGTFLFPALLLLLLVSWGTVEMKRTPLRKAGTAVLLQPSIQQVEKWSQENERATYDRIEELVQESKAHRPGLVVWPETAAPAYLTSNRWALNRVTGIVRASGTFHLVGCLHQDYEPADKLRQFNAALEFNSRGTVGGFYGKRHLVPFGEFVPFQKYLTFLGPVVGDLGSFNRGPRYEKFQAEGFTYTPMICYEVIFPGDVQKAFRTGADILVNISNDAWYGTTASAYQHALMAVVRTAEERKSMLRVSNTGISLATDPFGKILASSRLFEPGILPVEVWLADRPPTLYAAWGNWLPWLCLGVTGLWIGMALRRRPGSGKSR